MARPSRSFRHRLAVGAIMAPIAAWALFGFLTVGPIDAEIGRLAVLQVAVVAFVWLVASGFDVRYPRPRVGELVARLVALAVVVVVSLAVVGDSWVYDGGDGQATERAAIAVVGVAALALAAWYRFRSVLPVPVGGPGVEAGSAATAAVPGAGRPVALPGAGLVARRPHLISMLLVLGPLMAVEAILIYIGLFCGVESGAPVALATLLLVLAPAVLPGIAVLADRRRRHTGRGTLVGFAVPAGMMLGVAVVHFVAVFGLWFLALSLGTGCSAD